MKWLKDLLKVVLVTVFTKAVELITSAKDTGTMKKDKSNE